jgi:hypothetical protein
LFSRTRNLARRDLRQRLDQKNELEQLGRQIDCHRRVRLIESVAAKVTSRTDSGRSALGLDHETQEGDRRKVSNTQRSSQSHNPYIPPVVALLGLVATRSCDSTALLSDSERKRHS